MGDRGFESVSLQRRVSCEPDFLDRPIQCPHQHDTASVVRLIEKPRLHGCGRCRSSRTTPAQPPSPRQPIVTGTGVRRRHCKRLSNREWAHRARRFVRAEIKRAEISYAELAQRLKKHGLEETEASIANKLSRGTFGAIFFLAVMKAIGRQMVNLDEI
jgi:hypothetical protein